MSRYKIEVTRLVKQDLNDLRHQKKEAIRKLFALEKNPFKKTSPLQGNLKGYRSFSFSLKGAGAFRAILKILNTEEVVLLILVGPRENLYRKAQRRVNSLRDSGLLDENVE